ncbi:hypothetical protein CVT25_005209, partial [Psilocybe cyanescens]
WWKGTKKQTIPLEKVQHRALRLICAAFKTTPIAALEIEASIPPIKHQLDLHTKRCAIRFNKLSTTSSIIQRLPDSWRADRPPTEPPPLPTKPSTTRSHQKKTTTLTSIATHTSPQHERIDPYLFPPWRRTPSSFENRLIINVQLKYEFRRTGGAAVGYHLKKEIFATKIGLGGHAEVYDGEMAGLMMAATQATNYIEANPDHRIRHIHFFADNSAAVQSIFDPKPRSAQHYARVFHEKITHFLDNTLES